MFYPFGDGQPFVTSDFLFHKMEVYMIDYRAIEVHIKRAHLQRSAALGNMIANGIVALWSAVKRVARYGREQATLASELPHAYSISSHRPKS